MPKTQTLKMALRIEGNIGVTITVARQGETHNKRSALKCSGTIMSIIRMKVQPKAANTGVFLKRHQWIALEKSCREKLQAPLV